MERRGLDTERRQVQERNLERTRLREALAEVTERLAGLAHRAKDKIAELFGRTPQESQKADRVEVDALFGRKRKPEMDSGRGDTASQGPGRLRETTQNAKARIDALLGRETPTNEARNRGENDRGDHER